MVLDTILMVIAPAEIITLLTPLIVLIGTWIVRVIFYRLPGWAIVTIVVPVVSILVAVVNHLLVQPDLNFIYQVLYGCLAVLLHQIYKQLQKGD